MYEDSQVKCVVLKKNNNNNNNNNNRKLFVENLSSLQILTNF